MNFKKWFLPSVLVAAVFAFSALPALAGHGDGGMGGMKEKSCPMGGKMKGGCDKMQGGCNKMQGGCDKGQGCGKMGGMRSGCSHTQSPCPIAAKFCGKACWLLSHKDDLGLTDEQVSKIKSLDLEVEKNSIRGMAEMKIFGLEIENRLNQSEIDVEALESMIDSGMAGMATGAKATVKAYADLKAVLTEEQKAKAKELKKAGHSAHCHHQA